MKRIESIGAHGEGVARRVADVRAKKGLSYAEIARRTGGTLNELAVRRVENLARRVDVDDLFRLAGALDTTAAELLGGQLAVHFGHGSYAPEDMAAQIAEYEEFRGLPESEQAAQLERERRDEEEAMGMTRSEASARDELSWLLDQLPGEAIADLLPAVRRIAGPGVRS